MNLIYMYLHAYNIMRVGLRKGTASRISNVCTSKTCISRTLGAIQVKCEWFIQEALLQL